MGLGMDLWKYFLDCGRLYEDNHGSRVAIAYSDLDG